MDLVSERQSRTDLLAKAFCDCNLPKSEWTHHAHLRVGLWHLLQFSPTESLPLLRNRIRNYNVATGGVNSESMGYHETITRFYIWIIDRFLQSSDRSMHIDSLADELIGRFGGKELPLRYWSRERLFSPSARLDWMEPDILPLVDVVES